MQQQLSCFLKSNKPPSFPALPTLAGRSKDDNNQRGLVLQPSIGFTQPDGYDGVNLNADGAFQDDQKMVAIDPSPSPSMSPTDLPNAMPTDSPTMPTKKHKANNTAVADNNSLIDSKAMAMGENK